MSKGCKLLQSIFASAISTSMIEKMQNRENRYFFCMVFFFGGLMFSKSVLSISVFLFVLNYLADKEIKYKIKTIFYDKILLAVMSVFLLHIAGLAYTTDFQYAADDIRIKLPLLIFPLIFATEKQIKSISFFLKTLKTFIFFLFVAVAISFFIYLTRESFTLRTITPFMSHIRFGMLCTLATFFSIYLWYMYLRKYKFFSFHAILFLILGIYFGFFTMFILASANAIVILLMTMLFVAFILIFFIKNIFLKIFILLLLIVIPAFSLNYVINTYKKFFPPVQTFSEDDLKPTTALGNKYKHTISDRQFYENGVPVHLYICDLEMRKEWNKISNLDFDGKTYNNTPVYDILIRYLSSKNLPKDAYGISKLNDKDIKNIENGLPNYLLENKLPVYHRLYEFFREYFNYKEYNDPTNSSLFSRLELWKLAIAVILKNPFFGVGTGDVSNSMELKYKNNNFLIDAVDKPHNQFISITVAFGFFGLAVFLISLFYPMFALRKYKSFYFMTVWSVLMLSMLTEDTLQTQIGASIFAFFYSYFLFAEPENFSI